MPRLGNYDEITDGVPVFALVHIRTTAGVVGGEDVFRVEPDCLSVIGDGTIVIGLLTVCFTPEVEGAVVFSD